MRGLRQRADIEEIGLAISIVALQIAVMVRYGVLRGIVGYNIELVAIRNIVPFNSVARVGAGGRVEASDVANPV